VDKVQAISAPAQHFRLGLSPAPVYLGYTWLSRGRRQAIELVRPLIKIAKFDATALALLNICSTNTRRLHGGGGADMI
jgi:hypothetical protein